MRRRKLMIIGYGRTSTTDQTAGLQSQERDLKAAGAAMLFTEQVSSVAQRTKLAECLAFPLCANDGETPAPFEFRLGHRRMISWLCPTQTAQSN